MSDSDEVFENNVKEIIEGKVNFSVDEQNIIDIWLEKLSEPQETKEKKTIRNKYARTLAKCVIEEKQLLVPFTEIPPDGDLISLSKYGQEKVRFQMKPISCKPKSSQGTRPITKAERHRRTGRSVSPVDPYAINDFEDPEEMAKVIARCKGQSFAEFIVSISRHTADFGQELRRAMKFEINSFREYIDHVLTQRIKDLTEVLDEEQCRELQKIKDDLDKWQVELAQVKCRIEEIIPNFDLEAYKKDRNYLKKLFTVKTELSEEDSFKKWQEESCHRLKWINDSICKITRRNEQIMQDISNTKCETANLEARETIKQQTCITQINCEISEYQNLQLERDKLLKENNDLLAEIKGMGNQHR